MNFRRGMGNSKKGNVVLDMITFCFYLFALAVVLLIAFNTKSAINTALQGSTLSADAKAMSQGDTTRYASMGDNVFIMAVVLLWIFVFVASFLVDTHPIFFAISLALLIFVFIISAIFANTFDTVSTSAGLTVASQSFPKMVFVMRHLLQICIAVAMTVIIGLYGKG